MQQNSTAPRTFLHRTDLLAVQLGVRINDLPKRLGISRRTLFAGRACDSSVSRQTWLKLQMLELDGTRISGRDLAALRLHGGFAQEEIAKAVGLSLDEYQQIEETAGPLPDGKDLTLGFLRKTPLIWPKEGGGLRGLKQARWIKKDAEKRVVGEIEHGNTRVILIQEAISLLRGYIDEPSQVVYLAEAEGIIRQVLLDQLGIGVEPEASNPDPSNTES